ncbi:hypothetical protein BDP81DRAFT_34308 [Colletotrichum phormii]|uniref:Uncharacterized protein n=1 Tax=Colletotrichum phormii TaxID=359342 RepID=A0AAI9ZQU6_9PEZI|nr:uncharacterized protein BDP81DRAFT_34308 [Colletotrichum phormii]KAK1636165.1 hypothetical protein BDP81DRAFT_34308 [Colletotrichum phormii]
MQSTYQPLIHFVSMATTSTRRYSLSFVNVWALRAGVSVFASQEATSSPSGSILHHPSTLLRDKASRFFHTVGAEPLQATSDGWRCEQHVPRQMRTQRPKPKRPATPSRTTGMGRLPSLTLVLSRPLVMTVPANWTPGSRRLYPNRPLAAGHLPKDLPTTCISVAQPMDRASSD